MKALLERDPAKRFKMLSERKGSVGKGGDAHYPFYSPDGIHGTPGPDIKVTGQEVLEVHQILIDPIERDPQKKYRFYGKSGKLPHRKPNLDKVRKITVA